MNAPKNIIEAAEFYIEHGFRPIPVYEINEGCKHYLETKRGMKCTGRCHGKVPKIADWCDRKISPDDFEDGDNLGLVMGKQSNGRWFVAIDIDGDFDIDKVINLPKTLECPTNRGRHLIFEVPANTPLGNWNDLFSTRSGPGTYKKNFKGAVDLKYCRGVVISPPSITQSGKAYQWDEWIEPAELDHNSIRLLVLHHKKSVPTAKIYNKWSADPSHKNKKP